LWVKNHCCHTRFFFSICFPMFSKFYFFWEFWNVLNFGENLICGNIIYPQKLSKKGQIWVNMLEFTNIPKKTNFMPKSRNFGKKCKNMLDQVRLILLRIPRIAKEILICSKVCKLKNMQKHILPFPTYEYYTSYWTKSIDICKTCPRRNRMGAKQFSVLGKFPFWRKLVQKGKFLFEKISCSKRKIP